MEIELRLDADGRTTYDPNSTTTNAADASTLSSIGVSDEEDNRGNHEVIPIDYSTKVTLLPSIRDLSARAVKADPLKRNDNNVSIQTQYVSLLSDCKVIVAVSEEIKKHTFWVGLDEKPRCAFEQMAMDIFHHHIPQNYIYDKNNSGSEWWVQIRPKQQADNFSNITNINQVLHDAHEDEKTTRKRVKVSNDDDTHSILFHWDKDEELRVLTGGALFVHPHISTVTYLTDKVGAPTMILPCLADCTSGAPEFRCIDNSYFVSCPKVGKHISFDGRFLHAAPSQLLSSPACQEEGKQQQNSYRTSSGTEPYTRVTFLVNIWLNHRPIGVQSFPCSLLPRLSTISNSSLFRLLDDGDGGVFHNCIAENMKHVDISKQEDDRAEITWLLGANSDAEERIKVHVPLLAIQRELDSGGTLHIQWEDCQIKGIQHVLVNEK